MDERDLRGLIGRVRDGRLSRRAFVQRMVAVGLTAPMAGLMLAGNGVAMAADIRAGYKPTKAGGGGALKLLWWQAPTLINPHFAIGTKDQDASRIFYEPLAAWDADGNLVPVLAASIPSKENGALAADGRSVVWTLKPGVKWHDGKPLTADDLVFTWEYARDPATAAVTAGSYKDCKVEKVDDLSVRVLFDKPTPYWCDAFVGIVGMVLPKHLFGPYSGAKSRDAPQNLAPVGTGPYRFVEFRPGDIVRGALNPDYHLPNRPYFDTVEMKGGGDAVSAARAVLQTGEYDYAWNMLIEDEVLKRLETGGKGRVDVVYGGKLEFLLLNATDPNVEVDGERASITTKHPAFSDPKVCQAMNLLVDRKSIQTYIYGRTGKPTANTVNGPERFVSKNTSFAFDPAKANALLDEAGWKKGSDGIRAKDGKKLQFTIWTNAGNKTREQYVTVMQQQWKAIGVDATPKTEEWNAFLTRLDPNHDYEVYLVGFSWGVDPDQSTFWSCDAYEGGFNDFKYCNKQVDELLEKGLTELDQEKRKQYYIDFQNIIMDEVPAVILNFPQSTVAVNKRVKNMTPNAISLRWNAHTWWVTDGR
jgi:peptide/nickel transport system substrate-binding protein